MEKENKLKEYKVNSVDRNYNFWQRDSLNIELFTSSVFIQKLNYIHCNPVKAGLCKFPEEYYFSSALFYEKGVNHFSFIKHYLG